MNAKSEAQAKIIAKIKKLVALSESPNENEAAVAMAKAQALLAEHNLEMSDLSGSENNIHGKIEVDGDLVTDSYPWRRPLAVMVAKLYFCKYFFVMYHVGARRSASSRRDNHNFVGERHNIVVAKLMFEYLTKTVERLAADAARTQPVYERDAYRRSFMHAAANRLCWRIDARIKEAVAGKVKSESTGRALVLLDVYAQAEARLQEYADENLKLKAGADRSRSNNLRGKLDGDAAGKNISLDGQVGGPTVRRIGHDR